MGSSHLATFIFLRLRLQCYRRRAKAILRTTNFSSSPTWTSARDWLSCSCDSSVCIIITTTTTHLIPVIPPLLIEATSHNFSSLWSSLYQSWGWDKPLLLFFLILGASTSAAMGKTVVASFQFRWISSERSLSDGDGGLDVFHLRGRGHYCCRERPPHPTPPWEGNSLLLIHLLAPYQLLAPYPFPYSLSTSCCDQISPFISPWPCSSSLVLVNRFIEKWLLMSRK